MNSVVPSVFDASTAAGNGGTATFTSFDPTAGTESDDSATMKSVATASGVTTFTFAAFTAAATKCPLQTGAFTGYRSYIPLLDADGEPVLASERVTVMLRATVTIPGTKAAGLLAFGITTAPTQANESNVGLAGLSHSFATSGAAPGAGAYTGGAHNSGTNATMSVIECDVNSGGTYIGTAMIEGFDTATPPVAQVRQSRNSNFVSSAAAPLYLAVHVGAVSAVAAGVEDSQLIAALSYAVIRKT